MGSGAFIAPLRRKGVSKDRIIGIDIESACGAEDKSATTVRGVNFFRWSSATEQKFTKIVANPPYVAIRKLAPELRSSLLSHGGTDVSFKLRSALKLLVRAFLSACLRILSDRGNLAFVLPAAWDYAQYANTVRIAVLQQFQSVEVHRCHEPLFPNVREGCVVLVAKTIAKVPSERSGLTTAHLNL